jgi:hypothetical protein
VDLQRQVVTLQIEAVNPTETANADLNQVGSTTRKNPITSNNISNNTSNNTGEFDYYEDNFTPYSSYR